MIHVVLFEPCIPANTGNVIRMCANSGARLHLIEPLGFDLDESKLRRAGLDYRDMAVVEVHPNLDEARAKLQECAWFATSASAVRSHVEPVYPDDVAFIFGPEPTGLPPEVLGQFGDEQRLRIPMMHGSRSLNLSNAAAVIVYEAWRQRGFAGAASAGPGSAGPGPLIGEVGG